MPGWLLVLLVMLATHRLTRLAIADNIPLMRIPREAAIRRLDPAGRRRAPWGGFGRSVAYLLTCPWCMSVWVGGFVVWATVWWHGLAVPWLVWPAASTVTGLVASWESEHEQRYELNDAAIRRDRANS